MTKVDGAVTGEQLGGEVWLGLESRRIAGL